MRGGLVGELRNVINSHDDDVESLKYKSMATVNLIVPSPYYFKSSVILFSSEWSLWKQQAIRLVQKRTNLRSISSWIRKSIPETCKIPLSLAPPMSMNE